MPIDHAQPLVALSCVGATVMLAAGGLIGSASVARASWAAHTTGLPAPVTLDGIAGARPGMTAAAVSYAWMTPVRLGERIRPGCQTATISRGGMAGYALFERGRFGAVFFRRGARTPSGIRIGSSSNALRHVYRGRLTSRPHAYEPSGRYYFLTRRARPHWQIRFDVSARGRVTQISFGNAAVRYVEGCA